VLDPNAAVVDLFAGDKHPHVAAVTKRQLNTLIWRNWHSDFTASIGLSDYSTDAVLLASRDAE
jgi:hypothetical protein